MRDDAHPFRTSVPRGSITRLKRHPEAGMSDIATLVAVSRLYYELGETQEAIASRIGVTRPQVSRLLKEARLRGVVEIRIVDDTENESPLGGALRDRFGLSGVHLAPSLDGPPDVARRRVARLAGQVLRAAIRDGQVVGVGDGATMSAVADELPSADAGASDVDASVVPLCGGFWRPLAGAEPFRRIGEAIGATIHTLHAPGLLDDPATRAALCAHPGVRSVTNLWARLDVALYGLGGPAWSEASVGTRAAAELRAAGAVGEVLISPFTADGALVGESLRARTIGFDARELRRVPVAIGVAEGPGKVLPILGALRGGLLNTLVTDVRTAEAVLERADEAAA
jgi:DNA-binding transcriptional regulator LsrR (DeoR family)